MDKNNNFLASSYSIKMLLAKEALREEEEKNSSRKKARQALVIKRLTKRVLRPTVGITKY